MAFLSPAYLPNSSPLPSPTAIGHSASISLPAVSFSLSLSLSSLAENACFMYWHTVEGGRMRLRTDINTMNVVGYCAGTPRDKSKNGIKWPSRHRPFPQDKTNKWVVCWCCDFVANTEHYFVCLCSGMILQSLQECADANRGHSLCVHDFRFSAIWRPISKYLRKTPTTTNLLCRLFCRVVCMNTHDFKLAWKRDEHGKGAKDPPALKSKPTKQNKQSTTMKTKISN